MRPVIEVRNLSKRYVLGQASAREDTFRELLMSGLKRPLRRLAGTQKKEPVSDRILWALRDVSFDLAEGDTLGLVGRNGAGKSTLLKILSRITDPSAGFAKIRGRLASLLEVGTGFHPELTGRENIYLNGSILGMRRSEINAHFDEIVAFSEIERFLDTPVKRYSSGMYVRLAFAVASHLNPEVLLVDEVLAVGDAGFQKKCLGKMSEVAGGGRTVIFVSHNMAAVSQLCNRAIWLDKGQLRQAGTPDEVIRSYLAEGSENVCERRWEDLDTAPGDNRVRLVAARMLQYNEPSTVIDINRPCQVEMAFELLKDAKDLVSGINVYNQQGVCLFAHCDWRPNQLPKGGYLKRVEIPARILAEGPTNILVQLIFYDPDVPSVVLPDALSFDAVDSDDERAIRGHYKGTWPGMVRLALDWSDAVPVSDVFCAAGEHRGADD